MCIPILDMHGLVKREAAKNIRMSMNAYNVYIESILHQEIIFLFLFF